jgi:tetratricopeptide (TPR) repeat protein
MFSMNENRSALAAILVVAMLGHARPATCEEPPGSAEQMFQEGRAALAEEDYEGARSYFERSYKLDPALGTLLNLAVCEEKVGKLRAALAHLQEAMDKAEADDRRRPLIAQRLARLDLRVPRLTIRPSRPFDPEVRVSLDAKVLGPTEIGTTIRIDPGTHVLDCAGPRGERCTIVFTVNEGQEAVQVPALSTPATPAPSPREPEPLLVAAPPPVQPIDRSAAERRSFAYAAGGFGLASIAVGLLAGVSVLQQKAAVEAHCVDKACDEEGMAAADKGKTLSIVSTVATGLGVVVMGTSVYLLMSAPTVKDSPTGISVAGSF